MCTDRNRAILWDMDGVLIHSAELHRRAWRVFLERKALPLTDTIHKLGFGRRNEEVLPELFGDRLSSEQIARFSTEKEQCYRDLVRQEGIQPVPGALDWLARFYQAGIPQALATSACRANTDLILSLTGAAPYLQAVVVAEDVPRGKPDPDLFLEAAGQLGVPPARCLVIEDSLHGIRAARAAGMRCIALATTHTADKIHGCDRVLPDMTAFSWATWRALF